MADETKVEAVVQPKAEPPECPGTKTGIKTTEFWITIATVLGIGTQTFNAADWKVQVAGIIGASGIMIAYILTRRDLKSLE